MEDNSDPNDSKLDEAAGLPSPWFRPLVIVPIAVAIALLLWGLFGTGWLL